MDRFVIKVIFYALAAAALLMAVYAVLPYDRDYAYGRMIGPKQHSLILGSSRTAQGIAPEIITQRLQAPADQPIYNYAFTMNDSPYGWVYWQSIKRKLIRNKQKTSLFIVCVDPWALGDFGKNGENRELNGRLERIKSINTHPNWDYLGHYNIYQSLFNRYLHLDAKTGRYINDKPAPDSVRLQRYIEAKLQDYRAHALNFKASEYRIANLKEIMNMLRPNGKMYLVRMPVSPQMHHIEQSIWPDFDLRMQSIAHAYQIPYINFTNRNAQFATTDGNHLQKQAGEAFTQDLCDSIQAKGVRGEDLIVK